LVGVPAPISVFLGGDAVVLAEDAVVGSVFAAGCVEAVSAVDLGTVWLPLQAASITVEMALNHRARENVALRMPHSVQRMAGRLQWDNERRRHAFMSSATGKILRCEVDIGVIARKHRALATSPSAQDSGR